MKTLAHSRDYFPLGIAFGPAFCNRVEETELLINNLNQGKHTLLMASRRYGKSSLALHSLKLSHLPYIETDFYMARNEKVIESYLLKAAVDLIGEALGPIDKLIVSIKKYVKDLKPKLDLGSPLLKLELIPSSQESDPASNIKEALLLLESLLAENQKRAVLLLDEFQTVGLIAEGKGIEGAIRHVAQKTQYLTFIFSGSHRRLLKSMFEDETRPLYKLCWKIDLKRIAQEHYEKHIQGAARMAWKKELDASLIDRIFSLTERHPYYINKLCDHLFSYHVKKPPQLAEVEACWMAILQEEKSEAIREIALLSLGQKGVLLQIAKGQTQLMSKQAIVELDMPNSSIATALEGLEEKDMIEWVEENQCIIVNPVVKYYVLK